MQTTVFTGGGSGGHIYPGLAVAKRLQESASCRVVWIGSKTSLDREIVERAGIEFRAIPSGKLRRYFSLRNISDIIRILAGFFVARKILRDLNAVCVFSKGGFVSVPPCYAAASLGIPVLTHESDFSPGLATRLNTRVARVVFVAYEETARRIRLAKGARLVTSGNPVRDDFARADPARGFAYLGIPESSRILLVLGGSQGAQQVNELVVSILDHLLEDWVVVHQTGAQAAGIPPARPGYFPVPFIHAELPDILAASDTVLGRSGAGTLWEAAASGKPMVLVPLAGSGTRGDQVENAAWFVARGAAISLEGEEVNPARLVAVLDGLVKETAQHERMAAASRALGRLDAAGTISREIAAFLS